MKNAVNYTRKITILFVLIFTIGFSQPAFSSTKTENPVEVKFLKKVKEQPLFQLNINNIEAGEFVIKVKDGFNNVLYKESVSGKKVERKYLLDGDEPFFENLEAMLIFEITNTTTDKTYVYKITRNSKFVEDILVAKR